MGGPTRTAFFIAQLGAIAIGSVLPLSQAQAAEGCTLGRVAELPITMAGTRPLIAAKINNQDARFVLDSGAFFGMMSAATAAQFNLKLKRAPFGLMVQGVGGSVTPEIATVKEFGIAGALIHNVEFLVGGSEVSSGEISGDGLIGQNFLEQWDVEYDFSKGVVRLFKPEGCKKHRLAYWVTSGQPYSEMEIQPVMQARPHTIGVGYVNDQRIRVMFDTGAYTSILSLKAAAKAGIKADSPGVVEAGYSSGIGRATVKSYIATASSFKIGDTEEIKNARLRIADIDLPDADMLLGSDFFVSHHIFVSNSQHRLYVTYNGGPVFNLSKIRAGTPDQAAEPPKEDAAADRQTGAAAEEHADPDALARRGEASAARHDFEHALADLSKAIELRPGEPEYLYQRAMVYRQSGQAAMALADLDHVLTLNQDFLRAYLPRAEIRFHEKNVDGAVADLDRVDRLAPKQSDIRFVLAERYEGMDRFSLAIKQYDLWIQNHPDDSKRAVALGARCRCSAIENQDLAGGLADCNQALSLADKKNPIYGHLYENRGLLELRQANYEKAILDFDAAVKTMPRDAFALYGRGVAKMRKNKTAEGEADIAEAVKIAPNIAAPFTARGLSP